jgi:TonB family protein
MRLLLTCCLLLLSTCLFAQQNDTHIVHKDTINLRGFIYYTDGKPVKYKIIESKQLDFKYTQHRIGMLTDSNGYFVLNGAKTIDTLTIRDIACSTLFYNLGSRFVIIYLPIITTNELNLKSPIEITAKRTLHKPIPSFTIVPQDFNPDFFNVAKVPEPVGGTTAFFKFIQNNLKYPEKAIISNIEGTVEVGFTVFRDGSITDVKLLKGIGYGCDEQVLEAVKRSHPWRPGIFAGRPVVVKESVSVKFSLTDN